MKCPLLKITRPGLMQPEAHPQDDCLKEECTWWDKTEERCAILTITTNLDALASVLTLIEAKMPQNKLFGKKVI